MIVRRVRTTEGYSHCSISFKPMFISSAKKWTVYSRRADLLKRNAQYLNKNCTICSVHFEDVMFANFWKNRLKPDAVPTLFNIPNPPKAVSLKRKTPKNRTSEISQVPKKAKFDLQVNMIHITQYVTVNLRTCT